jgi:hypothetical protein
LGTRQAGTADYHLGVDLGRDDEGRKQPLEQVKLPYFS